jgi:hypothetical protein
MLALALHMATPYAIDGDTIVVKGEHIRVLQINTPELGTCYAQEAKDFTQNFLNGDGTLLLKTDKKLGDYDKYHRSLRYVFKGKRNLSLDLIRLGYAKPLFFHNIKGTYAQKIEQDARQAEANRLGLWKC